MYHTLLRPLVRAAFIAAVLVGLLIGLAHIGRNWNHEINRLTSIQIGIERELRKMARR